MKPAYVSITIILLFACALLVFSAGHAATQELGAGVDLGELSIVRTSDGRAVARFGEGPLTMISEGDLVGRNRAEVVEIIPDRVVIEEVFEGADGRPNRARIILKDGEKGGQRYMQRMDGEIPTGVRPVVGAPGAPEMKAD